MIALAAADYGLKVARLRARRRTAPPSTSPHGPPARPTTTPRRSRRFARSVEVVTYEFENIPPATADILARHAALHPNARALSTTQDRLSEKDFVNGLGIPTAPFRAVDTPDDLDRAIEAHRPARRC